MRLGRVLFGVVPFVVLVLLVGAGAAFAAPVNDNWASASSISGLSGYVSGSSTGATGQTGEPHGYTKSVWFVWVAPASGSFVIDAVVPGGSPARVSLYTGSAVNALTQRSTPSTPNTEATTTVTSGTTYYVQVQGISPTSGPFALNWGVPVNDDFANAMSLSGVSGLVIGSSKRATGEVGEPFGDDLSVWFSWIATSDGVEQFGGSVDGISAQVSVFTGSAVASLSEVSIMDGSGTPGGSTTVNVSQGRQYFVQVQPYMWQPGGAYELDWSATTPPGLSGGISQGFDARGAGGDPTRTRQSVGPVSVDVASGNVLLSIPGPSFPSPAGSLGFSASWNSLPPQPTPERPSIGTGGACLNTGALTCHAPRDYSDGARSAPGFGVGFSLNLSTGSVPVQLIDHSALAPDPPLTSDPDNPESGPEDDPALAQAMDFVEVVSGDGSSRMFTHQQGTDAWLPTGMAMDNPAAGPNDLVTPDDQSDGARIEKDDAPGSGAPTWTLVDADGTTSTFGPVGADGKSRVWSVQTQAKAATAGSSLARLDYTYAAGTDGTLFPTAITEQPSGRSLSLVWNALDATHCAAAILCITGPDAQTWRYVGDASGGTSGELASVSDGTRTILGLGWDTGRVVSVQSADDLDPTHASPGYDSTHTIAISYDTSATRMAANVTDRHLTLQGSQSDNNWQFAYFSVDGTDGASFGCGQFAGTSAAHATTYQGVPIAAGAIRLGCRAYTTVLHNGGTTARYVTGTGGRLMILYPWVGGVEQFDSNPAGQPLWSEDGDGKSTDYSYDGSTGQLLSVQQPDPDGTGPLTRPTTFYRYNEATIGTATTPGTLQSGLRAEWYPNQTLSGLATSTTWSKTSGGILDENWTTTGPPALGSPSSNWSARFSGMISAPSTGDYFFQVAINDGASVYVDDKPVVSDWASGGLRTVTGSRHYLTAGPHRIVVEYFQASSGSELHLSWKKPGDSSYSLIPSSQVAPDYGLQTSVVSPMGEVGFSHYADPTSGQPDYAESGGSLRLVTSFTYDALGRILTRVQPKGNAARTIASDGTLGGTPNSVYETDYSYYADSATAAPPSGCPSGSAVNQAGQLETTSRAGYADQTLVYDIAARVIASTNGKGTTCSSYDAEGRLVSQRVPGDSTISGCPSDASATACYTYDPSGLTRSAKTAKGTVLLSYDEDGQVTGETQKDASGTTFGESSISYSDSGDPYQTIVAAGPLATTQTYTWQTHYTDQGHQLLDEEIVDSTGGYQEESDYGYDGATRLVSEQGVDVGLGIFTWISYDNDGNILHVYNRHGTACQPGSGCSDAHPYADFAYTHDADGRITAQTRTGQSLTSATTSYTYDAASRLATATLPTGLLRTYHYDDDSNRTSIDETPSGGSLTTVATYAYSTTAQDKLSTITAGGSTSYAYNTDGDTTSYGTNTLTWNGNGKIASDAPTSSASVAYSYDPFGRLQERATTGPTADNEYIYAGTSDTPIMVTNGAGTITESYLAGPLGTRRLNNGPPLVSDTPNPSGELHFTDGLGNNAGTINLSGTRTNTYTYDPFGTPNETTPTNTLTNRYLGKNGRPLDTLSGLILMGARAYDATTGRFLSVDPIEGGSANLYDYANQNPVTESDPDGTSSVIGDQSMPTLSYTPSGPSYTGGSYITPPSGPTTLYTPITTGTITRVINTGGKSAAKQIVSKDGKGRGKKRGAAVGAAVGVVAGLAPGVGVAGDLGKVVQAPGNAAGASVGEKGRQRRELVGPKGDKIVITWGP